ncbi:MAG: diguanylate cyclase [Thermodesulfobacteriota bacterium]|nr:diguanylate cyclase [Thermodesulfobacteriota bacterium]
MGNHRDNHLSVAEVAKQIYALSARHKFPITKQYYAIWFEYLTKRDCELVREMDEIISSGRPFNGKLSDYLYDKYCDHNIEQEGIQALYGVQELIKNIIDEIPKTSAATHSYGTSLEAFSTELGAANHLSQVVGLVKDLISDTKKMAQTTKDLQKKLEEAETRAENLNQQLVKTENDALIDTLTGLHNRKGFDLAIKNFFDQYEREGTEFSLVMMDIDFFKKFNDTYGHQVGDEVLKIVGSTLHKGLKGGDFPARYGGEEFVVILPETNLNDACRVAENIRKNIEAGKRKRVKTGERLSTITVSLGVSQVNANDTPDSLIDRTDKALYFAKNSGRNNVKSERDL